MTIDIKDTRDLEKRERRAHLMGELAELYHRDTIFIRLRDPDDFYNRLDPAPEHERALSDDVEAYLFNKLAHIASHARIGVTFVVGGVSLYTAELMRKAFENHFKIRAEEQLIKNRKSRNHWLVTLISSMLALALFLFLAHVFRANAAGHPFFGILSEGFSIIGWVALWEPATYFLYGRSQEIKTLYDYMRLHRAAVTVQSDDTARSAP
ncbi:MAG: hypothetical protein K2M90_06360 [Treponemataceae bacterium]|nr:hypothetical protein [Treponemataceae bacterium]MDE7392064.1 hypothetical protein [Treponemataceae bacterium]